MLAVTMSSLSFTLTEVGMILKMNMTYTEYGNNISHFLILEREDFPGSLQEIRNLMRKKS